MTLQDHHGMATIEEKKTALETACVILWRSAKVVFIKVHCAEACRRRALLRSGQSMADPLSYMSCVQGDCQFPQPLVRQNTLLKSHSLLCEQDATLTICLKRHACCALMAICPWPQKSGAALGKAFARCVCLH